MRPQVQDSRPSGSVFLASQVCQSLSGTSSVCQSLSNQAGGQQFYPETLSFLTNHELCLSSSNSLRSCSRGSRCQPSEVPGYISMHADLTTYWLSKKKMVISFIQHKLSSGNSFPWAVAENQVETLEQDLSRQILPKEAINKQEEHLKITGGCFP